MLNTRHGCLQTNFIYWLNNDILDTLSLHQVLGSHERNKKYIPISHLVLTLI
jgi:hypothetical protein